MLRYLGKENRERSVNALGAAYLERSRIAYKPLVQLASRRSTGLAAVDERLKAGRGHADVTGHRAE